MGFRVDVFLKSLFFLQYALLLVFLTIYQGCEAREIDHHSHHHHTYHISNPTTPTLFFNLKNIIPGNKLPFYLEKKKPSTASPFLPIEISNSIPFSSKELPYLMNFFSITPGSKQAKDMEETLKQCDESRRLVTGEIRVCVTSMESLLDFIVRIFGHNNPPILHTTTFHSKDLDTVYQNFTVLSEPREIPATKMMGCHILPYPYPVFACHTQVKSKGYRFSLRGDNGDDVDTLSVCHMDTSEWDPNHKSFSELGTKPGDPACHIFLPHGNLLWVQYNPKKLSNV